MENKVLHGDCLELMKDIPDGSIDMVLCDPPYGTTRCAWDVIIPFEPLWEQYKRIIKPNGAIVLFGNQPFTSRLISSNLEMFKYCWAWEKTFPTGFLNANYRPLLLFEDIAVFSKAGAGAGSKRTESMKYHPQGLVEVNRAKKNRPESRGKQIHDTTNVGNDNCLNSEKEYVTKYSGYPVNILEFGRDIPQIHPTQKPVALCEYLIRTYTNECETVLDNCAGSGTTGVACQNTNRNYILIEKEPRYIDVIEARLEQNYRRINENKLF